ncbi:DNA cytosine methyltransferase [Vibrio lentus]|uniref:DNA cytosine methyltransferase n=1 Tax=Vibrio lentus TaxID=136468 RepID=UPI000C82C777|nr:DNA cytosine methyltransferase [Vibrio lentus]PMI43858.1 DNA (cytosine-5-)-methyltransferase [Vibrio lentus]PMJ52762.1 DNA (cytosine-5-)-methyltransferase [Vibrio lentus]PMN00386.1 DNA (cytosine-5-)-methyltransferase [Vibrio lentus]
MSAIDLFAGAGGFSLAAHQAGLDVLAAIELDVSAAQTYQKNIIERLEQKTKLLNGDILKIDPSELRKELGLKKGELQLILGGPPCQGFSSHRIKDAGVDDPRNKLLLRYYDFVEEFQPKAFLVENVAGLFWKKHASYLEKFKRLAEDNGYVIHFCDTLNAKDYGTPQNRKRAFILGVRENVKRDELTFPPAPEFFNPNSKEVKEQNQKPWKTASTVFEPLTAELIEQYIEKHFRPHTKLSDDEARTLLQGLESDNPVDEDDPCNVHMKPTEKMQRRFRSTRLNGSRMDADPEFELKCHANGYGGHKDVYGRVIIHTPSNTMTTGCNNPSKGRFVHPWKHHGFTLRHAARFQTFPDDYIFTGSTTDQAKQIGNAVPTILGYKLIYAIMNGME